MAEYVITYNQEMGLDNVNLLNAKCCLNFAECLINLDLMDSNVAFWENKYCC